MTPTPARNAQTAALEALIEAHAIELKLPTVRRRFRALAEEALREHQTPVAYLGALLEAEMAERAERRERRRLIDARFPQIKRLEDFVFTDNPTVAEFARLYHERAAKAGLTYTQVDHQSALGYAIWYGLNASWDFLRNPTSTASSESNPLFRPQLISVVVLVLTIVGIGAAVRMVALGGNSVNEQMWGLLRLQSMDLVVDQVRTLTERGKTATSRSS